jgi:hypothetical protein
MWRAFEALPRGPSASTEVDAYALDGSENSRGGAKHGEPHDLKRLTNVNRLLFQAFSVVGEANPSGLWPPQSGLKARNPV